MAERQPEKEAKQVIMRIGKQLFASKTCPSKDAVVKLLKEATIAFPDLKQSESLKLAVKPLSDSLVRHGLLHHKDKDVRLLVGICVCEIIRVLAPNPDFGDSAFRDIFRLLVSMFAELDDIASPYYSRRAKLLETVSKLQFCVLMLDTCEDLVLKMFKSFFSVVRDDHPQSLINSMSSIITCILEEKIKEADSDPLCLKGNTSQPLVDLILQNIIKERKGVVSASVRLAASVIENCGEKLERSICQFITSCILNRDAVGSVVKDYYHEIILEIFQIAPQMLLPVTPNLTHELLTDQVDVRIKALHLIRKLLALPQQNFAQEYRHVFVEFLNRFSDKSAEVRITALSCAKAFYMTNQPGSESLELISAIQGRLLDHDDKVRTEAVKVVCDLAKTNSRFASSDLISLAAERLRDKKVSVRNKALKKLVELYQEYCTTCAAGIALFNEHIEEIPCKILMLCYEKNCQEFRPQSMELVLDDLFPASLSTEERTRHWISMFSLFKPPHLKALKIILSQKRRLQDGIQGYLDLWNTSEEKGSKEAERKMEALVLKMSSCFPDPAKAKDCFQKLNELKDNGISSVLQQILNKENALVSETSKDVSLRELGDQNALSEFLHILSMKFSSNLFSSKQVHYILDCLSGDETENKHSKKYWVQLLLTIIGAFPSLLRGSEKQFQLLLLEEKIPFTDQLIEVLAREGYHMSLKLSDIYSSLEKVCLGGTPVQSKLAVSAIAALADTSEQFMFPEFCKMLVDSLCNGQNTPTVLQSLGCLAQHSISTFEAQEKVITHYIVEEIFQQNNAICSKDQDIFYETSKCCSSCELKVFGLKALVRSFLPHKHSSLGRPISFLLDIIQQILQNGGVSGGNILCEHNEACIRLAAAKAVLRLSRKWDLHISPQMFRLTVLTSKDRSPWVRRSFVSKVHKFLKNHVIPSRYACAFLFAALDSLKDLRSDALKYMEEFINGFGKGAQMHESMATEGAVDHPVYLIVFLIHVLAHDTNFPSTDCQDEKIYAQFMSPLFVTLEALVNYNLVDGKKSYASSYLRNILNAIKRADDAVDYQMTKKLHLLAEVGISILNSLNINYTPVPHSAGLILLPSSLYKSGLAEMREANVYHLIGHGTDSSFTKALVSSLKTEVSGISSSGTNRIQQFHENSLRPSGTRHSRSNPQSSYAVDLLINETKEKSDEPCAGQKEQGGTSHQEIDTRGQQNQTASSHHGLIALHNEFSAKNTHERDAHGKLEHKLSSSHDSATEKSSFSQNKVTVSSSGEDDTVSRCSSVCAQPSKSLRASYHVNHCSSKNIVPTKNAMQQDLDDIQSLNIRESSANGQRTNLDAFGCDSKQDNLPKKRDSCITKVPQAVKRNKRSKDTIDTSTSEVIDVNDNAIARRTRRQKLKLGA
ncbi:hypothetical protein ACJIZ3_002935 [Penstemon smallii]|uniref:Sister chromatid cohesion protein PDS5 homolog A n=1 Tax=Penstemon smallii TaxID=265156 RepID=A0ABD3U8Z2_9LAMI